MTLTPIRNLVIVGGGTAGWLAAAMLSKWFEKSAMQITLVESDAIGIVGVGEATVPSIRKAINFLGIDEAEFIARTSATFKLAIQFDGWSKAGDAFFHPFATHGEPIAEFPFYDCWAHMREQGQAKKLDAYSTPAAVAAADKFAVPPNGATGLSKFDYAYHFDAGLVAKLLREYGEAKGVSRQEGIISSVDQDAETGAVTGVRLEDDRVIEGDFFIDCSGFRSLLIEGAMAAGYEDWSGWLPCDRAIAAPTAKTTPFPAYTKSKALPVGWRWRIPLQTRTGNGYVYSSPYISDDEALDVFKKELGVPTSAEPRLIKFQTGMRKRIWIKNVYAVGLAGGFLEPLESTSIYAIQSFITRLFKNFPHKEINQTRIDLVNAAARKEQEHLRDFLILHYWGNGRHGEKFWDDCRAMSLPDSLTKMIGAWRDTATIPLGEQEFFRESSWASLFCGLGFEPTSYHPGVHGIGDSVIASAFQEFETYINAAAQQAPVHDAYFEGAAKTAENV